MTEKELILTAILNCRRIDLYTAGLHLTKSQDDRLEEILLRRQAGEALQYILGYEEFMGLRFAVDGRVFIPRPETELLVETVLEKIRFLKFSSPRILDIGTGSGNIAVSLAKNIPDCHITAVDISPYALASAIANARLNCAEKKIRFVRSDLFSSLRTGPQGQRFDMIISNPPYIPAAEIKNLPRDVQHEPRPALDGGADGMDFYRRIVAQASLFLKSEGFLFFEIGDGQKNGLEKIFSENHYFEIVSCIKDYRLIERIIVARLRENG